ncbi:hypothetical protein HN873_044406, partial [Arachis hypogaea]
MKDVNVFIAEIGNTKGTLALSLLAKAIKKMNKVAILHCVWRQGQANVSTSTDMIFLFFFEIISLLHGHAMQPDSLYSMYYLLLRMCESFNSILSLEVEANLVKLLDLAPQGKEEVLLPDFTPNRLKLKHANVVVPPLNDTHKKIIKLDDKLFQQNKSVVEKFCQSFKLKESSRSRRLLREEKYGSGKENDKGKILVLPSNLLQDKSNVELDNIGDLTPVQDFEAMFVRRDNPDWVVKATDAMANKIYDLIEDSHEGDNNLKVLECLAVLCKGYINKQELKQFNDFICDIWSFCQEKNLHGFCDSFLQKESLDPQIKSCRQFNFTMELLKMKQEVSLSNLSQKLNDYLTRCHPTLVLRLNNSLLDPKQ